MEYSVKVKNISCYNHDDGSIQIYIPKYKGQLFINWVNLPPLSTIINNGKIVKNIPAGQYIVELEDEEFYGSNKKIVTIDVNGPDELKIDFIRVIQPNCYDDTGSLEIFFSGGTAPYSVSYHKYIKQTDTDNYTFNNIANNTNSKIKITDSNGCSIISEEISIFYPKPQIDVEIIEPSKYGLNDGTVNLYLNNINNPKIGWYKLPNRDKLIAVNVDSIKNNLGAGDYSIKVVDDNNCVSIKDFTINQPIPTTIKTNITPDYSYGTEYNYFITKNLYNTILVPLSEDYRDLLSISPNDTIRIKTKDNTNKYTVILQPEILKINDIEYYAIYILPCFKPTLTSKNLTLIFKDNEYKVYQGFNGKTPRCSLCNTFCILDNNYTYAFNNNDKCEIYNDTIEITNVRKVETRHNLYDHFNTSTLVFFNLNNRILQHLNRNIIGSSISIRSLTTKSVDTKGSIFLNIGAQYDSSLGVYNDNGSLFKYKIVCFNKDKSYYNTVYSNGAVTISGLDADTYTIGIENYIVNFVNGQVSNSETFEVVVMPSNNNKNIIPTNIKKLPTFKTPPSNATGLFINIPPYNRKCKIYNTDYDYTTNSTYEIITNMHPAKYTIELDGISKSIYISKNQILQINSLN